MTDNKHNFPGDNGCSSVQIYTETGRIPAVVLGGADGQHDFYTISPQTAREIAAFLQQIADKIENEAVATCKISSDIPARYHIRITVLERQFEALTTQVATLQARLDEQGDIDEL